MSLKILLGLAIIFKTRCLINLLKQDFIQSKIKYPFLGF